MTAQTYDTLPSSELVKIYNKYQTQENQIKKFSDRVTAIRRVGELLKEKNIKSLAELGYTEYVPIKAQPATANESAKPAAKPKAAKTAAVHKAKKKRVPGALPGPVSQFTGMKIYKKVEINPRRENSEGWKSFNFIRNGMSYEEYRLAGGRQKDLVWDLEHDYVELKKA
jgi:hypothetical protein